LYVTAFQILYARMLMIVRDFDVADAKIWFPVSFLLVAVIYTGSKSLVRLPRSLVMGTKTDAVAIPLDPSIHVRPHLHP
jgi:hypothetical protein